MPAILFGSISTLADTSELQRQAFNQAFEAHGLDWRWDRDDYREMLSTAGGRDRIAEYARERGEDVDADEIHRTKSRLFQENLRDSPVTPREGVANAIQAARGAGHAVGLVTTTSPDNVAALLNALDAAIGEFDVVVDADRVSSPKPDPAAYAFALDRLGEPAGSCVAVEDNVDGARAAAAAGLACVAFPNENTAEHTFPSGTRRVEVLSFENDLRPLTA